MDFVKIGNQKKLIPPIDGAARFENEKIEVGVTHLKNKNVYYIFN